MNVRGEERSRTSRATSQEASGSGQAGRSIQVKLVLLGDQGVGKSSLALRFVREEFHEHQEATIGAAFLPHVVKSGENTIMFEIWDTAGQERYKCLAPMYYRGSHAAIVVYDVNDESTFTRASEWVKELRQQNAASVLIVLAGSKADLPSQHRAVSTEEARAFSEDNGLMFYEVSSKTGMAVNEVFMTIGHKLLRQAEEGQVHEREGIRLNQEDGTTRSGACCN